MADYGVTDAGFIAKPLSVIDDEVDAGIQGILGRSAGVVAGKLPTESFGGQLKAFIVDREATIWDLLEAEHASHDPNQNSGESQDAVASISGALRNARRFSIATGMCIGDPYTQLIPARVGTVTNTNARYLSRSNPSTADGSFTIAALTAWASGTGYSVGDQRTNNNRAYVCITAGTSAGSGGPTTTDADITDNTVHWKYMGEGTGAVGVTFQAETSGAIGALAGALATIGTPVVGWHTLINLNDAIVGAPREDDASFRRRRDQEIASTGNTTADAIRANILRVNQGSTDPNHLPVTSCQVLFNDSDSVDVNGLPPHSYEAVVYGGTAADIAQAIWDSKGAGTYTNGTRTDTVTDSQGNAQQVSWTIPSEVDIYAIGTGAYDPKQWPSGSDALVANTMMSALLTFTAGYLPGVDVRQTPLSAAMLRGPAETDTNGAAVVPASAGADPVPGLLEIPTLYIGTSPSPAGSAQINISVRQIAIFSSSNITLTATSEAP